MIKVLFIFLLFLCGQSEFVAKVIGVIDGDTIVILTKENQQIKIRLDAIDCPESHQDFGNRAKQATVQLCFGKEVKIIERGKDRYGRTLGFIYVNDICVNKELIRLGMAWHYKQYNHDKELSDLENYARENKIGLWSQPNPIPPWEFRKHKINR